MCAKKKKYIWSSNTCTCENGKYLGSIIGNSAIPHDKILEVTKRIPTKTLPSKAISTYFNKKRQPVN